MAGTELACRDFCRNSDAVFALAVKAGAKELSPMTDNVFWLT
jgi:hypothetical protein